MPGGIETRETMKAWQDSQIGITEYIEKGVGEEISVSIADITLQHVDVVARHVRVFHIVDADVTPSAASPFCIRFQHITLEHGMISSTVASNVAAVMAK